MNLLLIILLILVIIFIIIYNSIISVRNTVQEAKAAIDTVLQNRFNLIPNLIEIVKGYAKHEKEVFEEITTLRANTIQSGDMSKQRFDNENKITNTLKSIFAISENYPDLKANENFLKLQQELTEIEDRLQAARRAYNAAVKELNDKKRMFPSNIVSMIMGLEEFDMFEAESQAKENIKVNDLLNNK